MCIEIRNDKKWLIFFYKGRRGEPGIAQVANVKKKHVGKVLFLLLMSLFGLSFFFLNIMQGILSKNFLKVETLYQTTEIYYIDYSQLQEDLL